VVDLSDSKLFTPWADATTKVTVYLLTSKVAPLQQSFYFVNDGMSGDGRYLWFYCAFPPSGSSESGRTLGVADLQEQEVRHFPETQFQYGSPFVDPDSGQAYWCGGTAIRRRGPGADDETELINSLPADLVQNRSVPRPATHLSRSRDGKEFFADAEVGLQWLHGTLPLDGGDFELWQRFDRNYNHAQFSPVDPDLALIAQENHRDQITGIRIPYEDRLWLIRRGEEARPVFPTPTRVTHEWWDPDGSHIWCIRGDEGVWLVDIETAEVERIVWAGGTWHSFSSVDGKNIVGDHNDRFYRGCPSTVNFLNRETGRQLHVLSNPEMGGYAGASYHIDPHPRFCGSDRFVVFTTTVRGEVDLAIVPSEDLIERTS
jgi:hypothetical protein